MAWVTALVPVAAGTPLPKIDGQVDGRGAVLTVTHPHGREIYAQAFTDEDGSSTRLPWLDLGKGRFQGLAAHLLLDEAGRLTEFCAVSGLELEWEGRRVWRAPAGSEDAHVLVLPTETAGAGTPGRGPRDAVGEEALCTVARTPSTRVKGEPV